MPVTRIQDLRSEFETRFDLDVLPKIYARLSVPTETIQAEIRKMKGHFFEAGVGFEERNECANMLARQTARKAMLVGGVASAGGLLLLSPELAASLIQQLRHAQRLGVVYGFDPQSERGNLLLWQALAKAYGVDLPSQGLMGLHWRELPGLTKDTGEEHALSQLIRQLLLASLKGVSKRPAKYVPGMGIALSARTARRRSYALHEAMQAVYQEAWREQHASVGPSQEAREV